MRFYRPLLLAATLLAFAVVILGAYVRLSDAGLGCPDWPGCYGQLIGVPAAAQERASALAAFPDKPLVAHKAWKEMVHRYCAGTLGLLIALIAVLAWRKRRELRQSPLLPGVLLAIVVFQALLGMWTVTERLKPMVVSAHLLGGMTMLALLLWLLLRQRPGQPIVPTHGLVAPAALALLAVLIQIALGGWVSSNYAALACSDFPTCLGAWLPEMDFARAFQLHRDLGQNADGSLLSNAALTAIHWSHRAGALIVALIVGRLILLLMRHRDWRRWSLLLGAALAAQIGIGIANILLSLPLPLAVAHNAGAAILLCLTVALNLRLWQAGGSETKVAARTVQQFQHRGAS